MAFRIASGETTPVATPAATPAPAPARSAARRALRGFTLIELIVVMAIVSLLLTLALPRYFQSIDTSRETVLKENLRTVRETIDKFYGDTGRYPESLEELVERKYLRAIPADPITETRDTWVIVAPDGDAKGRVYDIRSSAQGNTIDGKPFSEL